MACVGIEVSSEIYVAILETFFHVLKLLFGVRDDTQAIFRVAHYF